MSQSNEHILKQAIANLPTYEAPTFIWDRIEGQLQIDHQDDLIQDASKRLVPLEAPSFIWNKIESELEQKAIPKGKLIPLWGRWAVAASVLLAMTYFISTQDWKKDVAVSYTEHTEPLDSYLLQNDWDADEVAFAEVIKLHDSYLQVFNDNESKQLKVELEELEEDRKELKDAIDLYGSDHELIRQLANLERDRTELIKKMANKI